MSTRPVFAFVSLAALLLSVPVTGYAQQCENAAGRLSSAQGRISIQRDGQSSWSRATRRTEVCQGDTVRASVRSRAAISLINQTVMRVDQGSVVRLNNVRAEENVSSVLRLLSGVIQFFSRKPRTFEVSTTTSTIGIRGTEFVISARDDLTEVTVFEGTVLAANAAGETSVSGGQTVSVDASTAPRARTTVRPFDQVQWSLFYPPVIALGAIEESDVHASVSAALGCARDGDTECAFARLDETPQPDRDATYALLRGALLLNVGRVEEARAAIGASASSGGALALQAVIAVAQNDTAQALNFAERAVSQAPETAAPYIALSYAQQSDVRLVDARASLRTAVSKQPDDALAWARLAELSLALGDRGGADAAAQRAVELDPNVARTHIVQGFAALARIDTGAAAAAFERALELDSSDPLAHLGSGLAQIRDGRLAAGRSALETAVALDSNNALLRPYLGKAYYAERRAPLDGEQFAMGKQLDPNDPTAYLFDAIRKQSENQPIPALADLNASIDNNDNRAVYRSRLALDADRAARGISLARVYNTLGFSQLGLNESRRSLSLDPGNASAHRFLSDSYRNVRRREISRVSELLQAQMLQDINTNPVQPSLASSNLNVPGGGPADVGLNEFTPLFESDGVSIGGTLLNGENNTGGGELVLSGLYDRFSFSLGGYGYETDGWRDNNQQEHTISNLFLQAAITPTVNAQLEFSKRETEEGDLAFNFDPEVFATDKTIERDLDSGRIGLRWSPNQANDVLLSHIQTDRETMSTENSMAFIEEPPFGPGLFPSVIDSSLTEEGEQSELQYIRRGRSYSVVAGASTSTVDVESADSIVVDFGFPVGMVPLVDDSGEREIEQQRVYAYLNYNAASALTLTLGASQHQYEDDPHDETNDDAKLGLHWQIDGAHALRVAAFQSTKPPLVTNRTLEPTQVAGFNQFYDDINGTRSETVGIGYDSTPSPAFSWGIEFTRREMEEPQVLAILGPPPTFDISLDSITEDREERIGRLYLYWTPTDTVAASIELISDEYTADEGEATMFAGLPTEVITRSVPISLRYFSPSGWFAGITATAVEQEIETAPFTGMGTTTMSDDESFSVVDISAGYRLPKRRGVISLDLRNVGDEEFNYRDDTYREFRDEPTTGPYFPETTGVVRVTLTY